MVDDAGADKRVAVTVEINAPGVAGAIGKNLELLRAWMIASDGRGDFDAGRRSFGNLHPRMSEHPVRHVEPAIRPPRKSVQQFMPIIESETIEQDRARIRHIVEIGILQEQKFRRLADIDPAVPEQNPGGQVKAIGKHRDLVSASIAVGILEDFDAISGFGPGRRAERILVKFDDPQPATGIPGHRHWVYHFGFGCEQPGFESVGKRKFLLCFSRRQGRRSGRSVRAVKLPASGKNRSGGQEKGKKRKQCLHLVLPKPTGAQSSSPVL